MITHQMIWSDVLICTFKRWPCVLLDLNLRKKRLKKWLQTLIKMAQVSSGIFVTKVSVVYLLLFFFCLFVFNIHVHVHNGFFVYLYLYCLSLMSVQVSSVSYCLSLLSLCLSVCVIFELFYRYNWFQWVSTNDDIKDGNYNTVHFII